MITNSPKDYFKLPIRCFHNLNFVLDILRGDNQSVNLYKKNTGKFDLLEKLFLDTKLDPDIDREIYVSNSGFDRFIFINEDSDDIGLIDIFTFPYLNDKNETIFINNFIINKKFIKENKYIIILIASIYSYYLGNNIKYEGWFNSKLCSLFSKEYGIELVFPEGDFYIGKIYNLLLSHKDHPVECNILYGLYLVGAISALDYVFNLKYSDMDDVIGALLFRERIYGKSNKFFEDLIEFAKEIYKYTIEIDSVPEEFKNIVFNPKYTINMHMNR